MEVNEMNRLALSLVLLVVFFGVMVAAATADPGGNNPQVQYRTFSCDNHVTYSAGFVGMAPGNFFLVDSTSMFVLKVFTEIFPDGTVKTFNYGIPGFDPSSLLTCSYTDPQGVLNIFQGFLTPRS
jgi:hypothetical protein